MALFNSTAFAAAANAAADLVLLSSSEPPPSSPPPSAPWTVCTDEQRTVWPCCHIAGRSNVGTVCTSASTCASSTHAATVTTLGIPATALEVAMAKARAKALRFYADDPSMPDPI